MKHMLIRIGIVVGVIALVALGIWWFTRSETPTLSDSLHTTESIAPLASVSPLTISYNNPPSDWKIYSSASMGFSVAYPSDWTVSSCGIQCVGWVSPSETSGQPALGIVKSTTTIAAVLKSAKPYLAAQENVRIGTITWLKLTLQHPTTGDVVTSYFVVRGSSVYEFGTGTSNADILAMFGKMLASFKFLK